MFIKVDNNHLFSLNFHSYNYIDAFNFKFLISHAT